MKTGYLSEVFAGVAAKALSAVEASASRSNQHEFNGNRELIRLFGRATGKHVFGARFIYLNDEDESPVAEDATVTWYDARLKHASRSEHRLYFPTTQVSLCCAEGDLLVIAKRRDGSLLVMVAQGGSTVAGQMEWLFGLTAGRLAFAVREGLETEGDRLRFATAYILEQLGIVVEAAEPASLEQILERFGGRFPASREFSAYARSTLPQTDARRNPDEALMEWMEREEVLFRTLEKHLIADRLREGFEGNTEGFLQFSLSVQNRRKSRVGLALENHMETVLTANRLRYTRGAATEGKARPDFVFPSVAAYRDPEADAGLLTILGVKSTCKDRWRQVLAEASRISVKHLLTLEAAISRDQLTQMRAHGLRLIVPLKLHETYPQCERDWLMSVQDFVDLLRAREQASEAAISPESRELAIQGRL